MFLVLYLQIRLSNTQGFSKPSSLRSRIFEVHIYETRFCVIPEIVPRYGLPFVFSMAIRVVEFSNGDTKLERFLPKNQHTKRKLFNFEFWINGELSKSAKI